MRRRMVDNVRVVRGENLLYPVGIAHGCNEHHQIQFRILSDQLLLDIIGIILIDVQNNHLSGTMSGDLPAQLAADGAASPCNHYHLAADIIHDFLNIRPDRLSPQQILYLHFLQFGNRYFPVDQLVGSGNGAQLASRFLTYIQDLLPDLLIRRRNGKNNLVDPIFCRGLQDPVSASYNGDTPQNLAMASGLVIDDTFYPQVDILAQFNFL